MLQERRAARSDKDDTKYEKIVLEMLDYEHMFVFSEKLTEILGQLGISDEDFLKTLENFSEDERN